MVGHRSMINPIRGELDLSLGDSAKYGTATTRDPIVRVCLPLKGMGNINLETDRGREPVSRNRSKSIFFVSSHDDNIN